MVSTNVKPSTLDGIKRLAKSIKRERGSDHIPALDVAARESGYQNFKHASTSLRSTPASPYI
ncbi:hypothetical protein UB46_38950 [Burkholderiaceae bacterium 16]|nr:hypothetical protein UB46_38950 [Burkholderiaceae bacterium 16]